LENYLITYHYSITSQLKLFFIVWQCKPRLAAPNVTILMIPISDDQDVLELSWQKLTYKNNNYWLMTRVNQLPTGPVNKNWITF